MPVAYWFRFGVLLAVLFAATGARGASIEISPLDSAEQAIVSVSGPFEAADTEQFRTKTSALTKAIVVLASDGGSLVAGIEIGTLMRLKGFASWFPMAPDVPRHVPWLGSVDQSDSWEQQRRSDSMRRMSSKTVYRRRPRQGMPSWEPT